MIDAKDKLEDDLVSVVCPLYKPNTRYLEELIKSINSQTYKNLEVVFSDDSYDNNNKLENYIKQEIKFPVRYVENKTGVKGIFGNLNNAINYSSGKYIQIFCQDDIMYNDFIKQQHFILSKKQGAGIVFSEFDYTTENGEIAPLEAKHNYRKEWPEEIPKSIATNYLFVFGCMPGNLSPVMLKKDAYKATGPFQQELSFAGDFDYWARLGINYDLLFIKEPLLAVRRHSNQASNQISVVELFSNLKVIYKFLLNRIVLKRKRASKLYLNEYIGKQFAYLAIKFFFKGQFKLACRIINEFQSPFNFVISFVFMLLTINGRIKIIKPENLI